MEYRCGLRGFDRTIVERIVRNRTERYVDTTTGRLVVIGRHGRFLVMIPYEQKGDELTPVTVHATSRQQVNARLKSGRLRIE
jgi:hypothetical protein